MPAEKNHKPELRYYAINGASSRVEERVLDYHRFEPSMRIEMWQPLGQGNVIPVPGGETIIPLTSLLSLVEYQTKADGANRVVRATAEVAQLRQELRQDSQIDKLWPASMRWSRNSGNRRRNACACFRRSETKWQRSIRTTKRWQRPPRFPLWERREARCSTPTAFN